MDCLPYSLESAKLSHDIVLFLEEDLAPSLADGIPRNSYHFHGDDARLTDLLTATQNTSAKTLHFRHPLVANEEVVCVLATQYNCYVCGAFS